MKSTSGRTDAKAEAPILWPPNVKSWLIGKNPDVRKNERQKEKRVTGWDGWIASPIQWTFLLLFSLLVVSDSLRPHGLQHTRFPCPSPSPRACSNSCPLSWWCHPTISSSVILFSCLQYFPASGSFQWVSSLYHVAKVLELQLQHQMNNMKRQKDVTVKDELPRLVVANVLQEKSEKITPERMKRQSQWQRQVNDAVQTSHP